MALVGIGRGRRELLFTSNHVEVTSEAAHPPQEGLTSPPPPPSKTTIAGAEGCWCFNLSPRPPRCSPDLVLHAHINPCDAVSFRACAKYSMCNTVTGPYEM